MDPGAVPAAAADAITYLDTPAPGPGEAVKLLPGIHWLRMPLPMALDHINLWLLEDETGFVLVDTGMAADDSRAAWLRLERALFAARPLRLIMLTHLHPDHAGLAAWLAARFQVPVWCSHATHVQMQRLLRTPGAEELELRRRFFAGHGVEALEELAPSLASQGYRESVDGLPPASRFGVDGDHSTWAGRSWRWLATDGHASGHICLHSAAPGNVLIAGDQILPGISPNVSLNGYNGDPNPLASYLASLSRLSQLDERTLVLPSHGRPFFGLTARALEIRQHHERQLARLLEACQQPLTANDTLSVLYRRPQRGFHLFLALGEALAHLEYLVQGGRLERHTRGGLTRYQRSAA